MSNRSSTSGSFDVQGVSVLLSSYLTGKVSISASSKQTFGDSINRTVTITGSGFSAKGVTLRLGDTWIAGTDYPNYDFPNSPFTATQQDCYFSCLNHTTSNPACVFSVWAPDSSFCWMKTAINSFNYPADQRVALFLSGIYMQPTIISDTSISLALPAWGGSNIRVTICAGGNNCDTAALYNYPASTITSISSTMIPSNGSIVTIQGTNLLYYASPASVSAGGYPCNILSISSSSIVCQWAPGQGQQYNLSVVIAGIQASGTSNYKISYYRGPCYVATPNNITDALGFMRNESMWKDVTLNMTTGSYNDISINLVGKSSLTVNVQNLAASSLMKTNLQSNIAVTFNDFYVNTVLNVVAPAISFLGSFINIPPGDVFDSIKFNYVESMHHHGKHVTSPSFSMTNSTTSGNTGPLFSFQSGTNSIFITDSSYQFFSGQYMISIPSGISSVTLRNNAFLISNGAINVLSPAIFQGNNVNLVTSLNTPIVTLYGGSVFQNKFTLCTASNTSVLYNANGNLNLYLNAWTTNQATVGVLHAVKSQMNVKGDRFFGTNGINVQVGSSTLSIDSCYFQSTSSYDVFVQSDSTANITNSRFTLNSFSQGFVIILNRFLMHHSVVLSYGGMITNSSFDQNNLGVVSGGPLSLVGNNFTRHRDTAVTLKGASLHDENCLYIGNNGGAILLHGNLTSIGSSFENNMGTDGAAISAEGSSTNDRFEVNYGRFGGNAAGRSGGAVKIGGVYRDVILNDGLFVSNNAGKDGGTIEIGDDCTVTNGIQMRSLSVIEGSAGGGGGAIHITGTVGGPISLFNITGRGFTATQGGFMMLITKNTIVSIDSISVQDSSSLLGGAIYLVGGSSSPVDLFLSDVHMINNSATVIGGGLYVDGNVDTLSITGGNVTENSCALTGAGIVLAYTSKHNLVRIDGVSFYNNSAQSGAGICILGTIYNNITLSNSIMSHHSSQRGSAFYIDKSSNVEIINTLFDHNRAATDGGAALFQGNNNRLTMTNTSWVSNTAINGGSLFLLGGWKSVDLTQFNAMSNSASLGAAVYISQGVTDSITITQSTLNRNRVTSQGAAIYLVTDSNVTVVDSTLNDNVAGISAALYTTSSTGESSVHLINCTLSGNSAKDAAAFKADGTYRSFTMTNLDVSFSTSSTSSAIVLYTTSESIDIIGGIFSSNQGRQGAAFQHPPYYTTGRLRFEGVVFTNNSVLEGGQGGAVSVLGQVDVVQLNENDFSSNSAREGGGAIYLNSPNRVNITGGTVTNCTTSNSDGGGILVQGRVSSITINSTSFSSCSAPSGSGGALMYAGTIASVTVDHCNFTANNASYGGSMQMTTSVMNQKRDNARTTAVVRSSSFTSNTATTSGGSLYLVNSGDPQSITLTDNDFESNTSPQGDVSLSGSATMIDDRVTSGSVYIGPSSRLNVVGGSYSAFVLAGSTSLLYASSMDIQSIISCPVGQKAGNVSGASGCVDVASNDPSNTNAKSDPILPLGGIIGIAVGGGILLIALALIIIIVVVRSRRKQAIQSFELVDMSKLNLEPAKKSIIDFDDIKDMKIIGHGAFGVVYSAYWRETKVAVKQIRSDFITTDQLRDFLSEVAILQNLRPHPNVEFCDGGSLYTYLRSNDVPYRIKKDMMIGIAGGMIHLHAEGVIHRDLAVRNILLTKSLEPKVSDFGLSRTSDEGSDGGETKSDMGPVKWCRTIRSIGTDELRMAPEAMTHRTYSSKSDVWSFGVLCWEICTVQDPWAGYQVATMVCTQNKTLSLPLGCADETVLHVMERCWQRQPEDRPSMKEIFAWLLGEKLEKTKEEPLPPHSNSPLQIEYGLLMMSVLSDMNSTHYSRITTNENMR
ncbi:extracellular nuclease [Planoprotostelium fungivorum]|uniref:receptor protein-tyrosine kinase n=1 Tax=Planoprotostelium fungivorum TaxID=1890364 RepID=A0A2P6N2J7_9EUKA|nr:extracellular nuclease [Planoprotostelium fungivorum]